MVRLFPRYTFFLSWYMISAVWFQKQLLQGLTICIIKKVENK